MVPGATKGGVCDPSSKTLLEQKGWRGECCLVHKLCLSKKGGKGGKGGEHCNVFRENFREKRAFEPNHLFPAQIAVFTRSGLGELLPVFGYP